MNWRSFVNGRRQFILQITSIRIYSLITLEKTAMTSAIGVIIRPSQYNVKESIDRLSIFLVNHGVYIYARINQQQELKNTGRDILPLEFLLFGNPKGGGALMAENPLVALDLPLKIISYEDEEQKVWLAYNQANYIENRYYLTHNPRSPLYLDDLIDQAFKEP